MKITIRIFIVVVILISISSIYFVYGRNEMKNFCQGISAGASISDTVTSLRKKDFKYFENNKDGQDFIIIYDSSTMGRFTCLVKYKDKKVVSAKYILND